MYIYDGITDWLQFHFPKNSQVMSIRKILKKRRLMSYGVM
nr:MAG TPA: Rolling Circle replication initiation protein [Caudoviricetes sp.]DAX79920.1 MAG TPA: Rolling Circle replication initiation protein [Caudoviricetes sp.]